MTGAVNSLPILRSRIVQEVLFVAIAYLVYSQVRGLAGGRVYEAFINAYNLIDIELRLGIFWELTLQQWVMANGALIHFFNFVYFYCFFPVLIPTAIFLYITRPQVYQLTRNAFLISGGIAVCFFLTLPTAPPRLVGMGFIDTLNYSITPSYSSLPGVNHFAALPSMHVGWTFLIAVGLYLAFRGWRLRGAFFLLPALMFTATIVTGNHYFLDGVLGLLVAGVALRLAFWVQAVWERSERPVAAEVPAVQAPNSS